MRLTSVDSRRPVFLLDVSRDTAAFASLEFGAEFCALESLTRVLLFLKIFLKSCFLEDFFVEYFEWC